MNIRNRLLLTYFGFSLLIIVVGLLFYVQLKQLIEPLTPRSIPKSVNQLVDIIDKKDVLYHILYKELMIENNLFNYVYTGNKSALEDYYMERALLESYIKDASILEGMEKNLMRYYQPMVEQQDKIIKLMHQNKTAEAAASLVTLNYLQLISYFKDEINKYHENFDHAGNEATLASVKQTTKLTVDVLNRSLVITFIIFIEALLISFLLAYLSARAIYGPVMSLKSEVDQIVKSNKFNPINPKIKLTGEIGELAKSFNILLENLRATTVKRDELANEVTIRKLYEQDLNALTESLKTSNKSLDEFAYAASHDLRAPLQAIDNLSTWIIEDCAHILPEKSKRHLATLKARVKRLDNLIAGILAYSRIGRVEKNLELLDINTILADVIDTLSPNLSTVNITIDRYMPTILADRSEVTQIFLNLIGNAIKYNDKEIAMIKIGYDLVGKYYQFYVADNGIGIDPKFHEEVFRIFHTLQPKDSLESSGIGLAIVKKIIEKEGGKIWIKSTPNVGTTFYFTWQILT